MNNEIAQLLYSGEYAPDLFVHLDPGNRFAGWLCARHKDGHLVALADLSITQIPQLTKLSAEVEFLQARFREYLTGNCTCTKPASSTQHYPGCPMIAKERIAELEREKEGKVLMPVEPLITERMKFACMGEFSINLPEHCPDCDGAGRHDCEICSGKGEYMRSANVPWTVMKSIFKSMYQVMIAEAQEPTQ
ncbi:MAG: hypothetical protein Q8L60_10425 [Gammaproteobacteria bacterium]|nr:hypothetical protein [Gammaproteobacteria bacterium]MDP2346764.1 hypothetical protein [Gammaproteobacteria bacterium]